MIKTINTAQHLTTKPYPLAIDTGYLIFISGQIGLYPIDSSNSIHHSIDNQTQQTLKNIKKILTTMNLKINNIVKINLFIKNINDLTIINEIYESFFNQNHAQLPARSCLEVSNLPQNAKIEIDAIAIHNTNNFKIYKHL